MYRGAAFSQDEYVLDHNGVKTMVVVAAHGHAIYGFAREMNGHEDKKGWIKDTTDKETVDVKKYDFKSTHIQGGYELIWCSKADYGYKMWGG